jgi:hypothetical protein
MTERAAVGLHIGANVVAAVRLANGVSAAAHVCPIVDDSQLYEAVAQCLDAVRPPRRLYRIPCHISLGPSRSQICCVPAAVRRSAHERLAMVELTAGAHFFHDAESLHIVIGEQEPDGALWAHACDRALHTALMSATAGWGVRVQRIAPSLDALASHSGPGTHTLSRYDGPHTVGHACATDGRLIRAWRAIRHSDSVEHGATVVCDTTSLVRAAHTVDDGSDGALECAYAAAMARPNARFAITVERRLQSSGTWVSPAIMTAAALLLTTVSLALPGWRAERSARASEEAIARLVPRYRIARVAQLRADSVQRAETAIAQLRDESVPALFVLRRLGDVLPTSAYLVSLSLDSTVVQASMVSAESATMLEALSAANGLDSVSLVGAITRETAPSLYGTGVPMLPTGVSGATDALSERVAIRFRAKPFPLDSVGPTLRRQPRAEQNAQPTSVALAGANRTGGAQP